MGDDLRHRYAEAIRGCGPLTVTKVLYAVMAVRDEELERLKVVETASIGAHALLDEAEAALVRVRAEHRVHRCEEDGHVLERTPNPCVNDGMCSCGQPGDRCPTWIALGEFVAERLASAVPEEEATNG